MSEVKSLTYYKIEPNRAQKRKYEKFGRGDLDLTKNLTKDKSTSKM